MTELLTFEGLTAEAFSVDTRRRTMTGVVVPWNKIGRHSNGRRWRFARGGLKFADAKYVRLNEEHVQSARLGRAISAEDTDEGLVMTFQVYDGRDGDRALAAAQDGVKTGFSVEIEFDEADSQPDPENPGVLLVNQAHLTKVAFVKNPAFTDARLISVRASMEGTGMPETETPETETAPAETQPVTFSAEQFAQFLETLRPAAEERPTVDPTQGAGRQAAATEVSEPLPYHFSRTGPGAYDFSANTEHDFSTDLFELVRLAQTSRDYSEPLGRINGFIKAAFADVEIADLPGTLPNRQRPDMWVPQRDYATPLWDMVGVGGTDGRKFDIPKFTSSSGLVSVATEKTEPAGGSFVDEIQTITPGQLWGKVEITRQAWRAGGSPQLSGILWAQMLREFYEDREAAVATFLATLTAATDITLTGTPAATPDNDDDQVTMNDLEMALADLQFARGGNRFRAFAAHQALYRVAARVKDDAGRPLYPMLNPQNANGTTERLYSTINVGGSTMVPAYALGTPSTSATNSWLFDPAVVLGWVSPPERLFWDFGATVQTANLPQLSYVTLGIYADYALANTDITGVRQVIFDPSV